MWPASEERQRLLAELERALAGSEQRLQAIVDSLVEAITIRAPDDRLIYANRAALDRLGIRSVAELAAADPRALMGDHEVWTEDGRDVRDGRSALGTPAARRGAARADAAANDREERPARSTGCC